MNTKQNFIYKPLTDEEIKNFKATPGKCVNHFKTLTEKEEYLLTSSLLDFLCFLNTHLDTFKYYLAMLYKKFSKDTIYQYYLEHAIKSPQINEFLKSFEVTVDVKEFINYYFDDRKNRDGDSLNHIFVIQKVLFANMDIKIKHYFERYDFVEEVKAIIKYCRYHFSGIEEIPENYKVGIIRKIETIIFLRNAPNTILESFS